MGPQRLEPVFSDVVKQRIPVIGRQSRSDLRPILGFESPQGGRKEITIRKHTIDRASDAAETLGSFLVFSREVADFRSRGGIANAQLRKDKIFLRMVVHLRVDFEIADDRANDLIIGASPTVKNVEFVLEDNEQPLDVAMFPGQTLNDHCRDLYGATDWGKG